MIIEVDKLNFNKVLENEFSKGNIVIMKFESMYCDACMALGFELEELDEEMDNLSILEIDCADNEALTQMYDIEQVPTMIIYKDAENIIFNSVGITLAADIEKIIKESM
jgi:thioredoxin 1